MALLLYAGSKYSIQEFSDMGVGLVWGVQTLALLHTLRKFLFLISRDLTDEINEIIANDVYKYKAFNSKPLLITFADYIINITVFSLLLSSGYMKTGIFHAVVFLLSTMITESFGKLKEETK